MQKQLISFSHVVKFLQHIKFKWGVNPNPPLCTPLADNIKTIVSDKGNYRNTILNMWSGRKVCKMW